MNNLKDACILQNNSWIQDIPDILPEPDYSKKHIRAINRLKNKMRNDRYHRVTANTFRVLVAAAVIFALAVTAFAIPATRDFIIEKFDKYSTVIFSSNEKADSIGTLELGYIPEGFELTENIPSDKMIYRVYTNDADWLVIEKSIENFEIAFDTEEYEYNEIVINSQTYVYYQMSDEVLGLIWKSDGYTYKITTNLDLDETIKISENIL